MSQAGFAISTVVGVAAGYGIQQQVKLNAVQNRDEQRTLKQKWAKLELWQVGSMPSHERSLLRSATPTDGQVNREGWGEVSGLGGILMLASGSAMVPSAYHAPLYGGAAIGAGLGVGLLIGSALNVLTPWS